MPETPLSDQIAALLGVEILPPLDANEIQSLHKALPGCQAVADDAARFAQKHRQTLKLDASVLAALQDGFADVQHFEPAEKLLEKLHLFVYHQRLQAAARCMDTLYGTTRRIRDFAEEGQTLLDFMKAFKPVRGEGKTKGGSGGE
ncbi:MAG: hypothetical protein ACTFAL_13800 [Candidatus Electronema sp. V4]|uniref:hypothetical protein n=1 Tax=Candidatus Electronema sp. V4 TaxID=3454756 RepID=UPI0040555E2C